MGRLNRMVIILFIFILVLGASFLILHKNIFSKTELFIKSENITNISLYSGTETIGDGDLLELKNDLPLNGQIKVQKNTVYVIKFSGENGYANGQQQIQVKDKAYRIDISPDFSEDKLSSILKNELNNIQTTINNSFDGVDIYTVENIKLIKKGEWCIVKLKYTGNDIFNSDTLRIVLTKENNQWTVMSNAVISLDRIKYPKIPLDVLTATNDL